MFLTGFVLDLSTSNGVKMPGTGEFGTALYLYPSDAGVQHSEVAATRDTLDNILPRWLAWVLRNQNYATIVRTIPDDGTVHSSVERRFALGAVQQADGLKPYRPEVLRNVEAFKYGYEQRVEPPGAA